MNETEEKSIFEAFISEVFMTLKFQFVLHGHKFYVCSYYLLMQVSYDDTYHAIHRSCSGIYFTFELSIIYTLLLHQLSLIITILHMEPI
jgi:hypothetical protein